MAAFLTKERTRFGQYPVPAKRAELHWSLNQPELAGITAGRLTRLVMDSDGFQEFIVPMLEAIDERNKTVGKGKQMGRPSRFTSLQLESVLLYRRYAGLSTIKETRNALLLDDEARELLGFASGLPSLKTMSRYMRERLNPNEHLSKLLELDRGLRQKVVQLPGMDEEARILGMDGSRQGTRYTPPIPDAKKRKKEKAEGKKPTAIVNGHIPAGEPRAITAPTAGFVGKAGGPKAGKGWQMMGLWTEHGTLLAWDVSSLNLSEIPAAERVLETYQRDVLPHRGEKTLSVLTADGAFNSNKIREMVQEARIIPNIHKASHKKDFKQPGEETGNAAKRNRTWLPFHDPAKPHYGNWEANGHGELRCSCGARKTKRADVIGKTGLSIATKGNCSTCGNITITVGQWRLDENNPRWIRCYRGDQADMALGNSLTFNDPLSLEYGQDRYGWNESIHATLMRRFGLLEEGSEMRDLTEVQIEFAIAFCGISILLLERAVRQQEAETVVPFPSAPSQALPLAA